MTLASARDPREAPNSESVHAVSTPQGKYRGKSGLDIVPTTLMKDRSAGTRRVLELTKFPCSERICRFGAG
jgi:hypothetical protein